MGQRVGTSVAQLAAYHQFVIARNTNGCRLISDSRAARPLDKSGFGRGNQTIAGNGRQMIPEIMKQRSLSRLERYALAVATVIIAFMVRLIAAPHISSEIPYILLATAVIVSAWFGGLGPGFFSTLLAAFLAGFVQLTPDFGFIRPGPDRLLQMIVFLIEGATISILMSSALRIWRSALEQRNWFSSALAAMSDAVIALDDKGIVTYLNPAARALTGWSQEEAAGQQAEKVLRLLDPETSKPISVFAGGNSTQSCLLVSRDETRILVEPRISTLHEESAEAGSLVILRDRTEWHERRRSEEHFRESEKRFRHLADAMPQIVWTAGADGLVDYYNQRWFDYTGLTPEQTFLADGWWGLVLHPEDIAPCAAQWAQAVRELKPFQIECRFKHGNTDEFRWFLGRAEPVAGEAGGAVRWYGTCTDIDEQKQT